MGLPPLSGATSVPAAGLDPIEAGRRLAEVGPNRPPRPPRPRLDQRIRSQLRDPMILMLLGAFVVLVLLGDAGDALIVVAVVVLNTTLGTVQEVRAASALDALDALSAPRATVVRGGVPTELSSADLVPGDVVLLAAGDVVPADLTLAEAVGLEVDESAVTGESVPVEREAGDDLAAATVVTRGRGRAVVTRTGAASSLGRIAAAVRRGTPATPLQRRLSRLSAQLVVVTLGLCAVVLGLSLLRGEPVGDAVGIAVSLAVAAIPESLPAVVAVALALGAHRMATRHALVRRLPAVETLGSVTVLACDKTGTLTEGRMTVGEVWTPTGRWRVAGTGYDVAGDVVATAGAGGLEDLMRDLVLCNDAHLGTPVDGTWQPSGDPMEAALLVAVAKYDGALLDRASGLERRAEAAFDAATRRMTTLHPLGSAWLVVSKGAPEVVLELIADRAEAAAARREAVALAERGYRVLAVADVVVDHEPTDPAQVAGLRLRGLVALQDPARAGAAEVIRACHDAGIRPVMITGDHPATARAIGTGLGLTAWGPDVVTGEQVARGEHVARIADIGVFARTHPEHKVDIVAAWQRRGAVVAMTGDGVNDAPALRAADIGIAMGDRGTEVARQAADLVLADDDLATVVAAVGEGRRVYANIRRFLGYGVAGGLAEVLVLLLGPFAGIAVPLAAGQILWINLVTHGLPGVAFGGEPADPADMRRPSPSPELSVLGGLLPRILGTATLLAAAALLTGLLVPDEAAQTAVFWCLGLGQLWLALALRAPRAGVRLRGRVLEGAVLVAGVLLAAAAFWAPGRRIVDTVPVDPGVVVLATLLSVVPAAVVAGVAAVAGYRRPRSR